MKQISILIVDDNFVARRGLRSFLQTESDIIVLGEASTGRTAIDRIKDKPVDIVLMDVRMPDTDGIEATAEILKISPETKVIMLTVVEEQTIQLRALFAGARGYLVYGRFNPEDLVCAIRTVIAGGIVTIPPIVPVLLENIGSHLVDVQDMADMESVEPLTNKEKEILGLITVGKKNREIADILNIEEKTVKNHINKIYSKLHIKSRYEAISYMLRSK